MARVAPHPDALGLIRFFAWLFFLSLPFWAIGFLPQQVIRDTLHVNLPTSSLMAVVPAVSAMILTHRAAGRRKMVALFARVVDCSAVERPRWFVIAASIMPTVMLLEWVWMRHAGTTVADPHVSVVAIPLLLTVFVVSGIGEELGWQGYAYERFPRHWSVPQKAIVLGLVGALWHALPYWQANHGMNWTVWQCLVTVAERIIIVWLFEESGGSVLVAVLFHTVYNVSVFVFPNDGSGYDPRLTLVLLLPLVTSITLFERSDRRKRRPGRRPG